ncbi:YegS/Rv2252/BmrU family lipid kinase [Dehalobacter sp. DCM]|uniref:YegS/Rv2252/BmrU family lipid kinase n=1 Tax=Dehalobacter sp. DCM TaxID=2907827 RepID=UPI00308206EA|nr:YegS/Rv2252/BmrU family lipid kinase [Dehalobacter sp. DCM]
MKILLIYNPFAGNGSFKNHLDNILEKVQNKGFCLTLYRIDSPEALENMIATIDINSFRKIWIAGGDGTIHQVINLLIKHNSDVPIGVYPVGTANDFAYYFNFTDKIDEMTDILLQDNCTGCDIGVANGHYFLNVASLGFLIDVSQKTPVAIKRSFGVLAYYFKGVEELSKMRPVSVKIRSKEINSDEDVYFILIMNGKSAGGFKKIAPLASMNDGLLDVYVFKSCPALELLPLVIKVLNGEHADSPYVDYFQTAELTIDCDDFVGTDMDGERGFDFPLKVTVEPQKLKIICRVNG